MKNVCLTKFVFMKKLFLIVILMVGTMSMAQEIKIPLENSTDYKELLAFYKKTMDSGKQTEIDLLRKEYLNKLGKDNFNQMKSSDLEMDKWLEVNIKNTSFKSVEEASDLLAKINRIDAEMQQERKVIQPIFSRLSKEVGTEVLFKKINEDLKSEIKL